MSSPESSTSPFWHIPGPSSKYHKREYARPNHQLHYQHRARNSTPDAELARSHVTATSNRGRNTSPLSHFTSLVRSHTAPMERDSPLTPLRSPHHTSHLLHDSPFSDYFTDEARSTSHKGAYDMPPPEVQRVLLRLNNLGAHVLRQKPSTNAFESIADKLDELERSLGGVDLSPPTRRTMSDSGFVDDDHFSQHTPPKVNGNRSQEFTPEVRSKVPLEEEDEDNYRADRDRILSDAQAVLERVSKANVDLRQRFEEMRELNDQHAFQVEESTRESLNLRSENESLKSTLAFDHSELLFLKLQLKALEVQAGEGDEEDQNKRVQLEGAIDQWKSDWDDVDARQRGRRVKHRVMSLTPNELVRRREDGKSADEEGDWKLDMTKKRQGRVQSITIRRTSQFGMDGSSDYKEEQDEDEVDGDLPGSKDEITQTDGALVVTDSIAAMDSHKCQAEKDETTRRLQYSGLMTVYSADTMKPAETELTLSNITSISQLPGEGSATTALGISEITTIYEGLGEGVVQQSKLALSGLVTLCEVMPVSHGAGQRSETAVKQEREAQKQSAWAEFMVSLTELAGMTDR
ncbi:hypothetical protein CAC42_4929 [Sphaceloma murrayae]|uniref:Uncharacterized protein n=1 Tax=Sphaceloma murrayae TaxID=2082308 RepID=A0A2K1QPE7_9PEZI|nr:hypothetical protein CAC42_4929 [Sphaceloma murrayae]